MSTATAPATGAEAVQAAWDILDRAKDAPWPDSPGARAARQAAVWPLMDALVMHSRLSDGIIRPGDAISGLEARPDALTGALDRIAEDARKRAAVLADVIGKWCGDEAAAKVRGEGEQA